MARRQEGAHMVYAFSVFILALRISAVVFLMSRLAEASSVPVVAQSGLELLDISACKEFVTSVQ